MTIYDFFMRVFLPIAGIITITTLSVLVGYLLVKVIREDLKENKK